MPEGQVIAEPLAKELGSYKGQWVAVFQQRVVAAGDSAKNVIDKALERGITDPLVFRVPKHPERLNFF